jgi:hypothetical protein
MKEGDVIRGNNGEVREVGGRLLVSLADWWFKDGTYIRAEYEPPIYQPDDIQAPVRLVLRNGDLEVFDAWVHLDAGFCLDHSIMRAAILTGRQDREN